MRYTTALQSYAKNECVGFHKNSLTSAQQMHSSNKRLVMELGVASPFDTVNTLNKIGYLTCPTTIWKQRSSTLSAPERTALRSWFFDVVEQGKMYRTCGLQCRSCWGCGRMQQRAPFWTPRTGAERWLELLDPVEKIHEAMSVMMQNMPWRKKGKDGRTPKLMLRSDTVRQR